MPAKLRLTPDVHQKIVRLVNAGAPIPMACQSSGVSWNTAKVWIRRGKDGEKPFAEFVRDLDIAKAAFVAGSVMRITKAAEKDWKAAAWLLERRYPEQFAQRTKMEARLEHKGQVGVQLYIPDNGRAVDRG